MSDEQELANARQQPMDVRVDHKNWKARSEAFEDIRKALDRVFSSDDLCINESGMY